MCNYVFDFMIIIEISFIMIHVGFQRLFMVHCELEYEILY